MLLWKQSLDQTSYSNCNPTRRPPSATEGPFLHHRSLSSPPFSLAPSLPPGATIIRCLQLVPMACEGIGHDDWVPNHRSPHLRSLVAPFLMSIVRVVTHFGNLSRTLVANSFDCILLTGRESVAEHIIVLLRHTHNLLQQRCSRHSIAVNEFLLCQNLNFKNTSDSSPS